MMKFNKAFNAKVAVVAVSILSLFNSTVYPSLSKDSLRVPMNRKDTKERLLNAMDVSIAAEGKAGIHHQGKMKEVVDTKSSFLGLKKETIETGRYVLAGEPGVNDVIRELREMGEGIGYYDLPESDLSEIADLLDNLGYGWEAQSLRQGKKVSIYNIDKSSLATASAKANGEFIEGVTTHAGIRTQNIHITKQEYDRLMVLGLSHLAARLGHEVTEINGWRQKAKDLMKEKKIDKIGTVSEPFNESWENGIRKWIRNNIEAAKNEDKRIHARGLAVEMEILVVSLQSYKISDEHARAFLPGNFMDAVLNPDNKVLSPTYQSATQEIKKLLNCIGHFRSKEYREMFIKTFIAMRKTPNSFADVLETAGTQVYSIVEVRFNSFGMPAGITIRVPIGRGGLLERDEQYIMDMYKSDNEGSSASSVQEAILWWVNHLPIIANTNLLNEKLKSVQFITELQRLWVQGLIDAYRTFLKPYKSSPSVLNNSVTQFSFDSPLLQKAINSLQATLNSKSVVSISYDPQKETDPNDVTIAMRELSNDPLRVMKNNRTSI